MKTDKMPKLILSQKPLFAILKDLSRKQTIFVADAHNKEGALKFGETLPVYTNEISLLNKTIPNKSFDTIVAIGGCTALDVGRFLAQKRTFIGIPTILSNSCISVNRSVVKNKKRSYSVKTVIPQKTIISIPEILQGDMSEQRKWCASGFGDLFSNIAACIENIYEKQGSWKRNSREKIMRQTPFTFHTLLWILRLKEKSLPITKNTASKLAHSLHESSISVIKNGNTAKSAGSEHALFYSLQNSPIYDPQKTTHGILVSIGTLCTVYIHGMAINDMSLFNDMKKAYKKVSLPTTWKELNDLNISENILLEKIRETSKTRTFFKKLLLPNAKTILQNIYDA